MKKTLALKAIALRDGALVELEAPEIVPGDIVQIEEGTIIPADGRIVTEDAFVQVDQSAITGESLAVDKHKGDTCYASSAVKRGEAFMVVTATGDRTFVGRAAALVSKASSGTGHFTEVFISIEAESNIPGLERYWNYSPSSCHFDSVVCLYCVCSSSNYSNQKIFLPI